MSARITSRGIDIVNPGDRDWTRHRYLFSLGAYGCTRCLVWANGPESAIDELADWCAEHKPGLLADDAVADEYKSALAEGLSEEEAYERSTVDTISCDHGHYFLSWEVSMTEDPSREELTLCPA